MRITSIKTESFSCKLRGEHISVHFKYTWLLQIVLKGYLSYSTSQPSLFLSDVHGL